LQSEVAVDTDFVLFDSLMDDSSALTAPSLCDTDTNKYASHHK